MTVSFWPLTEDDEAMSCCSCGQSATATVQVVGRDYGWPACDSERCAADAVRRVLDDEVEAT